MDIMKKLSSGFVFFDGGMGTMLQSLGLKPGEGSESWNISAPDKIKSVHRAYLEAGCDVITANTFGCNPIKLDNCAETVKAALGCAAEAIAEVKAACPEREAFCALDIGPLGKLIKPLGDLDFEDAVNAFAEVINAGKDAADLVILETFTDLRELKAAVLAAKENCSLPVFASAAFEESGTLMTGADPGAVAAMLEGLGVDALGANCSVGPKQLKKIVPALVNAATVPVIIQPNAGLPVVENGKTVFKVTPEEFADDMADIAALGARILGGCCGTTPAHIKAAVEKLAGTAPVPLCDKELTVVSCATHAVKLGEKPVLIGERINPTGKPKFKQALRDNDFDYIVGEGIAQAEKGVHILDVNVGLPEIDEPAVMEEAVQRLQSAINLPLQIDTSNPEAMARALRLYCGKPLINSVNGKKESMAAVFPLVKKYGGVVVALTLDENGIPDSAEGRLKIADRIVNEAEKYGIKKKDIIVDALTMAVSSDKESALVTLRAVKMIKRKLGVATCLGVSNVSFGLPARPLVNASFFSMALFAGLDAAIMNPYSAEMMTAYRTSLALLGHDVGFADYIDFASSVVSEAPAAPAAPSAPAAKAPAKESKNTLIAYIENGLKESAAAKTKEMLAGLPALEIIDRHIIPALDRVGEGFRKNTVFLPQLLASAEAAKAAFEEIRAAMPAGEAVKDKIILATVHGDIHDIGKNILKVLLQNYGYNVIDLGRDVAEEDVLKAVEESGARLVCLSALMTTTVPAMERTVKLIKAKYPEVNIAVGGAVLTKEYADMIGADFYSKDAMTNVRYAEKLFGYERN